jgi:hypothetical protein
MALAASASDVRSALAIPGTAGPSTIGPPQAQPAQPKGRKSKPEGISRELYSLIGSTPPSLTPAPQIKPKLMKKPALGRVKARWSVVFIVLFAAFMLRVCVSVGSGNLLRTAQGKMA